MITRAVYAPRVMRVVNYAIYAIPRRYAMRHIFLRLRHAFARCASVADACQLDALMPCCQLRLFDTPLMLMLLMPLIPFSPPLHATPPRHTFRC